GTENLPGIAGFGAAAEAAAAERDAGAWERTAQVRNILERRLSDAVPELICIGRDRPRLPNTACIATPGWKGETQVMQMDLAGFAVSAGSACSSGKVGASRVLGAMGFDETVSRSAIRISFGPAATDGEATAFAEAWLDRWRRFQAKRPEPHRVREDA
ncbi:MAG: aminotransferase class V-fold PLP-dependent enzyme, partial [Pseudomonadota bacterium]